MVAGSQAEKWGLKYDIFTFDLEENRKLKGKATNAAAFKL